MGWEGKGRGVGEMWGRGKKGKDLGSAVWSVFRLFQLRP